MTPSAPTPIDPVFDDELGEAVEGPYVEGPYANTNDSTLLVSLSDIAPNPWNPHAMTRDEMDELIESVRQDGQWRPILVVHMDAPDEASPEDPPVAPYRIVDGFHLYQALSALHQAGWPNSAKVLVLGANSEVPVWKQQLIGQTINHGLRGSVEDAEKTGRLVHNLLRHTSESVLARRLGIGTEGLRVFAKVVPPTLGLRPSGPALAGAVAGTPYPERKAYITALSFEDADKQSQFDQLLDRLAPRYVDGALYKGRRGQLRVDALLRILEDVSQSLAED